MRCSVLLAGALALSFAIGCTDGQAPPALDASVRLDSGVDLASIDGPAADMASCRTACDCPTGERCQNGACQTVVPNVFCCGTAACTGDNLCQSENGEVRQCSLPADAGVPPGGGSSACVSRACAPGLTGDLYCVVACGKMSASCVAGAGSSAHCAP